MVAHTKMVRFAAAGLAVSSGVCAQELPRDPVLARALRLVRPGGGGPDASSGPDVITGEIQAVPGCCPNHETTTINPSATVGTIVAYGLGTSGCNIGDEPVLWYLNSPNHPLIPQNMYRLETVAGSTRFEQIGQSWSKYAFAVVNYSVCSASPTTTGACGSMTNNLLAPGCSDPYTVFQNAAQSNLGPRYECNPFTAVFPDDGSAVRAAWPATADATSRRIRVQDADLNAAVHPSALFFGETIYISRNDACFGNSKNNASYRRFIVGAGNAITLQGAIGGVGTHRGFPAIYAWKDNGLGVDVPDPTVTITEVTSGNTFYTRTTTPAQPDFTSYSANPALLLSPVGDGWVYLGSKATNLGGGIYHYEYAIENLNSDRGIASFVVGIPAGAAITNAGWKQIDAHSGVPTEDTNRNAAWIQTVGAASITWASPTAWNAGTPTLGSYIRWGTVYNFRFDANVAPNAAGTATLGYFKPLSGYPNTIAAAAQVPGSLPCYANCDQSSVLPVLNANDFQCFLNAFASGSSYANCDHSTVFPTLNANDFQCFLNLFANGCS
jgi:hypothetical protein